MRWYIVKTNPRCEARAQASIERAGFTAYLPTLKKEFRHAKSKRWISRHFPVFVGYLFAGIPAERSNQFGMIRACDGVKDFLGKSAWGRDVIDVPARIVADIMTAQASGSFDQLRPLAERLKKGDRIKIDLNGLAEQETVVDQVGKQRATIMLEMFGSRRSVSVAIDAIRAAA